MTDASDLGRIWDRWIASLPGAHLLQSWEWGQVKARYGWRVIPLIWPSPSDSLLDISGYAQFASTPTAHSSIELPQWLSKASASSINVPTPPTSGENISAAALVLERTLPLAGFAARLRVLYCPKGPLLPWNDTPLRRRVLDELQLLARKRGAIFLKIDPDVAYGFGIPGSPEAQDEPLGHAIAEELRQRGWHFSADQIQFRNTCLLDLTLPEETLLAQMKPKTRYNLRLAERKGVSVRPGSQADFPLLYRMYAETSLRDGFAIRDEAYYTAVWEVFSQPSTSSQQPFCEPLIAEVEGEAVAAVVIFRFAGKAWYLYGMSREVHRDKMPNYLLQWEAIRRAQAAGCHTYDLWGAPDTFEEGDAMWGVYRFKEGLGARVARHIGAWDYAVNPLLYRLYTQTLPRALEVMRRRGEKRTRTALAGS